ncbi:MAG: phosphonate C-P lyase system protein PhnG [Ancalomicrobiaceae bacterium]|nr:phosphonate C-P lyase system protein PhnG [Ancalomicrobiaceae bacterium]
MIESPTEEMPDIAARQRAMAAFAEANFEELASVLTGIAAARNSVDLRRPEAGLVMLRGRVGGDGNAFNLGEASVARASIRLVSGEVGHAYVLGRDTAKARLAAIADALWQRSETRPTIERELVAVVEDRLGQALRARQAQVAATRVDFFTLVRGED